MASQVQVTDYPSSDPEEDQPLGKLTGVISDDDDNSQHPPALPFSVAAAAVSSAMGTESGTDTPGSKAHTPVSVSASDHDKPMKRTASAARLVSYAGDDDDEEDSSEPESDDNASNGDNDDSAEGTGDDQGTDLASSLSRSVLNKAAEDIRLPPAPSRECERSLQEKISSMYDKVRYEGKDYAKELMVRKDVRNPSIYEKLIENTGINEKGTNFPPESYNPSRWGKESFYDELAKAHFAAKVQKIDMERREKERKDRTKVEFISVTKTGGSTSAEPEKKKSKWDAAPVVNVPTGTRNTAIPAFGSLKKA